jgi:ferric-dicitrate binding protein FerR (iron transport regulator)
MKDDLEPRPEELLRAWRTSAVPVEQRHEGARERGIEAVRQAVIGETARKASRRRVLGFAALAAAAALLLGVVGASWKVGVGMGERSAAVNESTELAISSNQGGVVLQRDGKATMLEAQRSATLGAGDRLETLADGRAELSTGHSRWHLGRATHVSLVGAGRTGERVRLGLGRVDVEVTHSKERNVVVETPHAELLVVGTAFSVLVQGEGDAAETSVEVTRGVVWVLQGGKQQAVLEAGARWSSGSRAAATPSATPPAQRALPSTSAQQGTLAEENHLFRAALDARNRGDNGTAAELFGELLRRFPRSVVGEEASLGRLRALGRLGRSQEARSEAKRYLARFPSGHAREEAERVIAAPRDR